MPAKTESTARTVPFPGTDEGAYFHYTPEEAASFLPWSARWLRERAYRREIPFNGGGRRVTFTGLDIREISGRTAIRPEVEKKPRRTKRATPAAA
ncbi:hypothetical protein [Streptomyces harbinensis]|uniref:hypothetical protein n=1 Tax=Streptomyces harbinensis TaxID=1176198 RepID=UPI0036BD7157